MCAAATIPAPDDLLCEFCGYILNGLPAGSMCPECGNPIAASVDPNQRSLTAWEKALDRSDLSSVASISHRIAAFFVSSTAILLRPRYFFRHMLTRSQEHRSRGFAYIHWAISSSLFGLAAAVHWHWFMGLGERDTARWIIFIPIIIVVVFLVNWWLNLQAARLSAWEAALRAYRLPYAVVVRALHYHSAHQLPVALLTAATIAGYALATHRGWLIAGEYDTAYLYTLCGLVIISALYLFQTYWIAMRNCMYANR